MSNALSSKYIHSSEVHNLKAPSIIVPYLINLFHPRSVVDVGCGLATFLHLFKNNGVENILGIDGNWVDKSKLYIDPSEFLAADLEHPINIQRKFDMVICLEVVEHLKEESSDCLIKTLTMLGDIIIFSAAIPGQGGQNHINEQEYSFWQKKFAVKGFSFYDCLRPVFWNNTGIDWWYRQNMFVDIKDSIALPETILQTKITKDAQVIIHPDVELERLNHVRNQEIQKAIRNGEVSLNLYFLGLFNKLKKAFRKYI